MKNCVCVCVCACVRVRVCVCPQELPFDLKRDKKNKQKTTKSSPEDSLRPAHANKVSKYIYIKIKKHA
jgi:hypothetical protein